MNRHGRLNITGIIACCLIGLAANTSAQDRGQYSEQDVKAAFIFNMIKFTDWPADYGGSSEKTLNVCVLGDDASAGLLRSIDGKIVRNKPISVRHIDSIPQTKNCMVLFIARSEQAKLKSVTSICMKANILTIGDTEGYSEKGVIINLYKRDSKIRFQINLSAMEKSGLKISANVLKLADITR